MGEGRRVQGVDRARGDRQGGRSKRGAAHTLLPNFGFIVMGQRGQLVKTCTFCVHVFGVWPDWGEASCWGGVFCMLHVCVCGGVGVAGSNQLNNEFNSQTGSLCFL